MAFSWEAGNADFGIQRKRPDKNARALSLVDQWGVEPQTF